MNDVPVITALSQCSEVVFVILSCTFPHDDSPIITEDVHRPTFLVYFKANASLSDWCYNFRKGDKYNSMLSVDNKNFKTT